MDQQIRLRRLQVKLVTTGTFSVLFGLTSAAFGWVLASMIGALMFILCLAAIFVVGIISWWKGDETE